jgi:hypothetical protein
MLTSGKNDDSPQITPTELNHTVNISAAEGQGVAATVFEVPAFVAD